MEQNLTWETASSILYRALKVHFHSRTFSTDRNFPKISLSKVENFQLQNFFRREFVSANFSFRGKLYWVEMGINIVTK
jgi:hypothetical protein